MKPEDYIKKALRTEPEKYSFEGVNEVTPRIEHGVIGVVTEAGELADAIKKAKFYGKNLDKINLIEEVGDVMWYLAVLCDELGVSFEEVWDKNINKLKVRYPEKFQYIEIADRNLDEERKALENN